MRKTLPLLGAILILVGLSLWWLFPAAKPAIAATALSHSPLPPQALPSLLHKINTRSPKSIKAALSQNLNRLKTTAPSGKSTVVIAGHVTDPNGKPIAGANVALMAETLNAQYWTKGATKTDKSGAFQFNAAGSVRYYVSANLDDATADGEDASSDLITKSNRNIQLILHRLQSLTGHVLDAKTHQPITDFDIGFSPGTPRSSNTWTTRRSYFSGGYTFSPGPPSNTFHVHDSKGRFRLSGIPGFPSTLFIQAPGHFLGAVAVESLPPHPLEVALKRSAPIHGVVIGPNGAPVPGAQVFLGEYPLAAVLSGESANGFVSSDSNGKFILNSVFDAKDNVIWVTCPSYAPGVAHVRRGDTSVSVTLSSPCTLQGRVTINGKGKSDASVTVLLHIGKDHYRKVAQVQSNGWYVIRFLPPGHCKIAASYAKHLWPPPASPSFTARATATLAPGAPVAVNLPLVRENVSAAPQA